MSLSIGRSLANLAVAVIRLGGEDSFPVDPMIFLILGGRKSGLDESERSITTLPSRRGDEGVLGPYPGGAVLAGLLAIVIFDVLEEQPGEVSCLRVGGAVDLGIRMGFVGLCVNECTRFASLGML